ncbi:hypothetical protein POVCU1_035360 [Plasmodium ovale curtisi]|uniref:Rhoptry neck protein 2 n=1 Tax=Plasmodium ovale curtisi TaxID=864141 RepID=A0A1A8WVQ3_PLAOA|nr:hypothetical protein POVCU1_035360 [Plasmodium ovale curtisi]
MLKAILFTLLIYIHIVFIRTNDENRKVRNPGDYMKNESPTYSPKKKTKVIFYMPGQEPEEEENDNASNSNLRKGKQDGGTNKSTDVGSGTHAGNEQANGLNQTLEPYKNNQGNVKTLHANFPGYYDNLKKGHKVDNDSQNNQEEKLKDEYEKIRKQEEAEAERINQERMADINKGGRGKHKMGEHVKGKHNPHNTDYEYMEGKTNPAKKNGNVNTAANGGSNHGFFDEIGNGPYNMIGHNGAQGALPYYGPDGKPYGPYGGTDGKSYGPYGGTDGKSYGPYGGGDGKSFGPYGGTDGKSYGPYGGGDGKSFGPYGGTDGKSFGPYGGTDGKSFGPYGGTDGKSFGPYGGTDGKSFGPYGEAYGPYVGADGKVYGPYGRDAGMYGAPGYEGENPKYRTHLNVNMGNDRYPNDAKTGRVGYPVYFKKHFGSDNEKQGENEGGEGHGSVSREFYQQNGGDGTNYKLEHGESGTGRGGAGSGGEVSGGMGNGDTTYDLEHGGGAAGSARGSGSGRNGGTTYNLGQGGDAAGSAGGNAAGRNGGTTYDLDQGGSGGINSGGINSGGVGNGGIDRGGERWSGNNANLEDIHSLRPVNGGEGGYGKGFTPLIYHVQHGGNGERNPSEKAPNENNSEESDDINERLQNKRKIYKKPNERHRGNGSPHDSDDDSSDTEYELNEGEYKKSKPKTSEYTSSDNSRGRGSGHNDANGEYPRLQHKDIGYGAYPGIRHGGNEFGGNPIQIVHETARAKKRANEIEDNLNKGEYSRIKVGNKNKKQTGVYSDSEDSDDESNVFYVDNGQDMLLKEKAIHSHGSEDQSEDGLNANIGKHKHPVNYHFSNYMNFDKKNILNSNEIELLKMIGPDFSKEVDNYCRVNEPSKKEGNYLNISFEFSRALEDLRSEMIMNFNKRKTLGFNSSNNILYTINNSLNRKNKYFSKDMYEEKKFISEANSFRNKNENPLSAKYNKLLRQYLCHVFVKNPGLNQLERLYYHNLALGELIQPVRKKYSKLASSSVGLNYEIYIASSSNIFLLGHMLLLSLAYLSYNTYFVKGLKSFYSLETMMLANSDYSFFMYNEMCNIYYQPSGNFNKDLTFIPIESRPRRHSTYVGERKVTCDILELILNAITLVNIHEVYDVFHKNNVYGYENTLSFSHNAIRVFSQVCPTDNAQNVLKCDFEQSTLYNEKILKNDIGHKENQKSLKRAFDLLRIYAEIENGSFKGEPNFYYIKLILEQNLYVDFYKYLFWYDSRELIQIQIPGEKKKKRKRNTKYVYNEFLKRGTYLKKKLIKMDAKYNARSKALLIFYALVDKYISIFTKSDNVRKLFLDDVSSIRHHLYLNSVLSKSPKSNLEFMKKQLEELQGFSDSALKFIVRGNSVNAMNELAKNENLFYVNLFILSSLSRKDPVKSYYNDKKKMLTATMSEKIATSTSALIPHKLRKLVVGMKKGFLKKKMLTFLAKLKLLDHIPAHLLENIITSIRFTTHTIASMEIIQNAKYMPRNYNFNYSPSNQFAKQIFVEGGFAKYADDLMSKWFAKGFEEYKREKIENQKVEDSVDQELKEASNESGTYLNADETERERLIMEQNEIIENRERQKRENKLIFNQNDKWDHYINKEFAKALGVWLELSDTSYQKNTFIYKVVEDSKYLLENNIEENIFFSRTVKPTKQTAFRKFFNKIVSLGNMLLRKPGLKVEHALWFGAAIDVKKAFVLLEKVSELHKIMRDQDESWLINEAFIDIVNHIVDLSTDKHLREPFSVNRNPGMVAIYPHYHVLPHEERLREFQNSMCADHCASVWKMISSFVLQHLKNPDSLHTYESKFSKNAFGNKIDDKDFVNNFKIILGGDAVLHYFDNLLPKSMKKELKAMKYGVSLTSAFSLKMTKVLFNEMQLPYLSQMFYMQAPYFGHFIGKWQKERKESRMKEILGFMTLGTLSAYTILSAMDIGQHATDIGMGPATSCYTSTIPPPKQVCIRQAVKAALTNSTQSCVKSVFSVGLFASIGPYLFAPMAGLALWNVLKSEFKVLQRIDMALKGVFKNMWNKFLSFKGIRRLKNIFKRRKVMKKKIIQNAENKMNEMKNNPNKAKDHKMAVQSMHAHSKGGYHYISYARIKM